MAARHTVRRWYLFPSKQPFKRVKFAVIVVSDEHRIVPGRPPIFAHNLAHPVVDCFRVSRAVTRPDVACPSELAVIDIAEVLVSVRAVVGKIRSVCCPELHSATEFGALCVVDDGVVDPDPDSSPGQTPGVRMMRADLFQHERLMRGEARRIEESCSIGRRWVRRDGLRVCRRCVQNGTGSRTTTASSAA